MDLSIDVSHEGNKNTAVVSGEVDVYTAPKLKETLLPLVQEDTTALEVDMTNVNYLDSTGLAVFVSVLKTTREKDCHLKLVNVQDNVARLFDITGLDKIIDISMAIQGGK